MGPRRSGETPTEAELEILRVLWSRGPSTVRDVHEALAPTRGTGYTTILKLMQIMARKGLLDRDESARTHVYSAARSQEETQGSMVGQLLDKAFSGSAARLVERALDVSQTSPEELDEIRRLLDRIDEERSR